MSSRPGGSKWVGNAGLIIGLPWDKRKSLPRNSKGFEPVEGYFDRTTSTESSDSDDDSSETDTEELVRQEREKRIEAEARRKVVEEAKSNAAYLMKLVAKEKEAKAQQQRQREAEKREEERREKEAERRQREREEADRRKEEERRQQEREAERREEERRQREGEAGRQSDHVTQSRVQNDVILLEVGEIVEELDVGSNTEVFALPSTSRHANSSEGMYSPEMSVAVQGSPSSVLKKSTRLLPSRLSFGGEENSPVAEPTNTKKKKPRQNPPSHKSSKSAAKNLESTFLSVSQSTDGVSLNNDDTLIQQADHILATTESPFHPGKTSTLLKNVPPKKSGKKVGSRFKQPTRRLPSAILALDRLQLSGSDSDRDDTLEVLLADSDGHFKGLKTHLAKRSQVQQVAASGSDGQSTAASDDSTKGKTIVAARGEKGAPRRHFAKKSTGNMASKLAQKAKPRKSVTFAAGSSSEFDTEEDYRDTKRTTEAPPTAIDNIYMSFEEDNFDPPLKKITKAKKPKKVKKPPVPVQSGNPVQGDAERGEDVSSVQSDEHSSKLKNGAAKPAVSGSRKSTAIVSAEGEVPANRLKDRRARVSETPEHDSNSTKPSNSSNSILENVSLLLSKPPPQQAQWFVPGMEMELYQRRRKTKSVASSTTVSKSELGSKSEMMKGRGKGKSSKLVAPPLSTDEAPPTHAITTLASSESEVEERDHTLVDQESEAAKRKRSHWQPQKSTSQMKKSTAIVVSSASDLEDETIHEKVEESPPKRKRGQAHKSLATTLTPGTALVSRKSRVHVEAGLPPEEPAPDEVEQTATQEPPKRKRERQRKPMQKVTSSESELDDWLEAVRENKEQRDGIEPGKKGRGQPRKSKATGQSASSGSEMEGENKAQQNRDELLQRGKTKQSSKRGRGRLQKGVPSKPTASVSSESELEGMEGYGKSETESEAEREGVVTGLVSVGESTGGGEWLDESAYVELEAVVKKSKAKKGKGRTHKSKSAAPAPPASVSTTESEDMEELVKEPTHRDVPPPVHPPPAAPNDGLVDDGEGGGEEMSQMQPKKKKKKKKSKKAKHQIENENLGTTGATIQEERQPVVEMEGDEQQFDNFVDGGGDYDSPLSPADLYDDDHLADNQGSEVTNNFIPPAATTPGSAGSRGGEQAADLSGAQSIDVSVLPRLIKRKRARGSRIVVVPKSKKHKKAQQTFDNTVQDPSSLATPQGGGGMMTNDTYSMSTSGEEGGEEESDHFDGAEIVQSGGGRKYRRLRVEPKKSHTPGVRRSNRTRVAPVRHWENEQLEYDMNTSGAVLKGVLVPLEQEDQGGPSQQRPLNTAMIPERQLGPQEDDGFSPYRATDDMGNTSEMAIVRTLASASHISCSGEVVTEDSDAEVIIHKLHSSPGTANGVMTFAALGEKPRSSAKQFDMFFFVLKGKLLFQVDNQEFVLMPNSSINIPEGCIYCIRNTQHSRAEVYFYTHYTGNVPQ